MNISKTNSKLGVIPSINLPPIVTCRENCPCAKDCYARKGNFRFANVQKSLIDNLSAYQNNPLDYFNTIKNEIDNGIILHKYFRWHAAGDIVDEAYFENMVELAKQLPETKFLAFTKKYELVNAYIERGQGLPSNLNIVFSAWGKLLPLENPHGLPVAYIRFNKSELNGMIPDDAEECAGDCTSCLKCWNVKFGQSVVFNKH